VRYTTVLEDKLLDSFVRARSMSICVDSEEERKYWKRCFLCIQAAILYMDKAHAEVVSRDWDNL